jgi:PKD repeat protein
VQVLKIIDTDVPAAAPEISANCRESAVAGESVDSSAQANDANPALTFHWNFGDGVQADGSRVAHAWTELGDYEVRLTAVGLDNMPTEKICKVHVTGHLPTVFTPSAKKRFESD